MYIADLHIHSHFSRATSRDCDLAHLDRAARNKGVGLVGTGDFTHPAWRAAMREALIPAEEGLYLLRGESRLPAEAAGADEPARFVVTGEISTIYKKNGKTRKVHSLILLPGLDAAEALAQRLEVIGNIRSDGRPILGLDCRDLLEITLTVCPEAVFIPAHIWTPHFSLFGAFSGFDTIEECFEDLAGEIHALETGLSSDPPMNWRVSALDRFTLVSNSDAHSPAKLGREANRIAAPLSYAALRHAIQTGEGFAGTIEFFPEEGKYHLDGHRNCGICLEPEETLRLGGKCPVCGRKLTIGVQHRVLALADRPAGFLPPGAKPYESLVPLQELIAAATGISAAGQKAQRQYEAMLHALGSEFFILREAPLEAIERAAGPCVAEGVRRLRAGQVTRTGGYDGEYGKIILFEPAEREALQGQLSLFSAPASSAQTQSAAVPSAPRTLQASTGSPGEAPPAKTELLNEEQRSAVQTDAPAVAVIAGPGTGKTKTLVARIAHLIEARGVKPTEITAVTFTNQAAAEMRERLAARLGGKQALSGMTIGTFHAVCLGLLPKKPLLGEADMEALVQEALHTAGSHGTAQEAARAISRVKNGLPLEAAALDPRVYDAYCTACRARGARDLDDLLLDALSVAEAPSPRGGRTMFHHLLVDEFQDINAVQRKLVRAWANGGQSLFVIGDPDQSIYGFRGASAACFDELRADFPELCTIRLRTNYRSSPEILTAAQRVIAHNPGGARDLIPARPSAPAVRLLRADTPFSEGVWIAKEIARMAGGLDMLSARTPAGAGQDARPFSELTVLARTHRQLEGIEACLRHDGIPCIVCGRGSELADDAVRGVLAFFRFLHDPADALALRTCLQLAFSASGEEADRIFSEQAGAPSVETLRAAGCPEAFLAAYAEYLPRITREKPRKLLERWGAEHALAGAPFMRLAELSAYHANLAGFLNALVLGEEADLKRASGKAYASGAVRLMTLHGAKGLEFPVVFLAGLSAGAFPLQREGVVPDLEEERRLLFVGMTRARDELILTTAYPFSEFLNELPDSVTCETAPKRRFTEGKQLSLF